MRASILLYHWFESGRTSGSSPEFGVTPDQFRDHMRWLRDSGHNVISLADLVAALDGKRSLPPSAVAVTFDDGYVDFYEHAWPVLAEFSIPASLFMVAGRVGGTNHWDRKFGEPERSLLDWPRLRELADAGIDIGSHSMTHPDMRTLDDPALRDECRNSRATLENGLGREVPHFAYPHGLFDRRVARAVAAAGYATAGAVLLRPLDLFRSHRFGLMRAIIHADKGLWNLRLRSALAAPLHDPN